MEILILACVLNTLWTLCNFLCWRVQKKQKQLWDQKQDRLCLDSRIEFLKAVEEIDWTDSEEDRESFIRSMDRIRLDAFQAGVLHGRKQLIRG